MAEAQQDARLSGEAFAALGDAPRVAEANRILAGIWSVERTAGLAALGVGALGLIGGALAAVRRRLRTAKAAAPPGDSRGDRVMAMIAIGGRPDLPAQLAAYQRRIRRDRRGQYLAGAALGVGAYWVLVAGAVLSAIARSLTGCRWVWPGDPAASGRVAGRVAAPAHRSRETAAILDARLDNRQRVMTAVELLAAGAPAPLAATQLTTTAALLEAAPADVVYPVRSPWPRGGLQRGVGGAGVRSAHPQGRA